MTIKAHLISFWLVTFGMGFISSLFYNHICFILKSRIYDYLWNGRWWINGRIIETVGCAINYKRFGFWLVAIFEEIFTVVESCFYKWCLLHLFRTLRYIMILIVKFSSCLCVIWNEPCTREDLFYYFFRFQSWLLVSQVRLLTGTN